MTIDDATKKQMRNYASFLGLAPAAAVAVSIFVGTAYNYKTTYAHENNVPIEEVDVSSSEYDSAKLKGVMKNTLLGMAILWPLSSVGIYYATLYSTGKSNKQNVNTDSGNFR